MGFFSDISSEQFIAQANQLRASDPSIEVLYYMLGGERYLEWAHSAGLSKHEGLRVASPPIPPLNLRSITAADAEPVFLWSGVFDANVFHELFRKNWRGSSDKPAVLDFGCGCGRMTRFLGGHPHLRVHGSDINKVLVRWCQENLPTVSTAVNGAMPPLDFPDGTFDFLYSFSIFTHIPERSMGIWLKEIKRVLRSKGLAIVTTHGPAALDIIAGSEIHQSMFRLSSDGAREIKKSLPSIGFKYLRLDQDVLDAANAGDDYGQSFADHEYIRREWPKAGVEVAEIIPGGARGWQDIVILHNPD
ncbi:class I SAM-dependent methyltransferase [Bradyrhizobium diazoefficiens]|nr:class I SAM-dependent methyltransferase [Bradyrhizobium diazoefficiens]MBR0774550.1 class I SAM-dependent methyltransferase [Bradyrhizobium diazoefficiens]